MNERELFKKTFDSLPAPEYLAARAEANAREKITRRVPRRALRTAALIVLAVALLSACAVAVQMISSKPDLVQQCNLELDTLRALGLFTAQFEVTMDADVPDFEAEFVDYRRPELSEDKYEGVITLRGSCSGEQRYSYELCVDTDTGKITGLEINAKPRKDWVPYYVAFWSSPGSSVMGFYDNPEAIFDPDLTLDGMCSAWAAYQGYERWELPEGADGDVTFAGSRLLDVYDPGYSGLGGLTAAFFRDGKKAAEYYTFNYTPAAAGPYLHIFPADGPYEPRDRTPAPPEEDPAEGEERSAVKLVNTQLDELRKLGLLRSGLEVSWLDDHSLITAGRVSEEFTDELYFVGVRSDCSYCLSYDAGTDKIDWLAIAPRPADGSRSVADVYDAGYGAVIDEELTIGEYCELWAQYQGCERWELPEGVEESTRYLDAHRLDVWETGIYRPASDGGDGDYVKGLVIDFYRPGSDEPERGYVKYGPSDMGPYVTIGNDYLFVHYLSWD